MKSGNHEIIGRFAPSPSGRMHLGNIFTALVSWLSVKSRGGRWILRIEDLDPQRSRREYAEAIEDDLRWLGLTWDEGGLNDDGPHGPYLQSKRDAVYLEAFNRLTTTGLTYPCYCRRADILIASAPHRSDGRIVYAGTCRNLASPPSDGRKGATRLMVTPEQQVFYDMVYGRQCVDLTEECGDFIIRRADGAWAYQLAVVVDDALMGVTEVVRGNDLLLSTGQQLYLYRLLGYEPPRFAHLPLICNETGQRLSKRDQSMSLEALRQRFTPEELVGYIAFQTGISDTSAPITVNELAKTFNWAKIKSLPSLYLSPK